MSDPRLTAFSGTHADAALRGQVAAAQFVQPEPQRIMCPIADLCTAPEGPRTRQLLLGEEVGVIERRGAMAFVQAARDGYVGWVACAALGPGHAPTHTVCARATHALSAPRVQAGEICALSFGARLRVVSASGPFYETAEGWFVPRLHLRPANRPFSDPVSVAQLFFGTPYLWGGNSGAGIDCSGLVQAAFLAAGRPCPGDSDLQQAALGAPLPAGTPLQRGDLVFWKGHVALGVDEAVIIHANAHHMAVAYEPLSEAEARIAGAGGGPLTAHLRPA